jgi:hypothetical protein
MVQPNTAIYAEPAFLPLNPNFGLQCGQRCPGSPGFLVHNGGWYNRDGSLIGSGDLNVHHMKTVSQNLSQKDLFIILPEGATFARHQTAFSLRKRGREFNEAAPGLDHIVHKATYVIGRSNIYMMERNSPGDKYGSFEYDGVRVRLLLPGQLREMIFSTS